MRKWYTTAGLLFMAVASVYSDRASGAKPGKPAKGPDKNQPTDVKILEETTDPFATSDPTTAPSTITEVSPSGGTPAQLQMNTDGTFSLNIVSGADLVEQLRVIGF